jgi:hydrogenase expression/formation protein HypE
MTGEPYSGHRTAAGRIRLAHGAGGRLARQLLDEVVLPAFRNPLLDNRHDGAVFPIGAGTVAFTTDSYVADPIFFPGGDIGKLAVFGAVNDLAMCGARPLALSVAFILEEGFEIADLARVCASIRTAADDARVGIATGDTKVVERGAAAGLFINTSAIGAVKAEAAIEPAAVRPGDVAILSGDIARHGTAMLAAREQLELDDTLVSDAASIWEPVYRLIELGVDVRCLRDLTRGGLAAPLNEIAEAAGVGLRLREQAIAVLPAVRRACERFGLDPYDVACAGRFVAFVPEAETARALEVLRAYEVSSGAAVVGVATAADRGLALVERPDGTVRALDVLGGDGQHRLY